MFPNAQQPYGGNPYVTVGSPNYAAPLLDFSALNPQNKKNQQGQQQQGQQQNQSPGQNFAARLRAFLTPQQQMGPTTSTLPAGPLSIGQGSVAGANDMLAGVY